MPGGSSVAVQAAKRRAYDPYRGKVVFDVVQVSGLQPLQQ